MEPTSTCFKPICNFVMFVSIAKTLSRRKKKSTGFKHIYDSVLQSYAVMIELLYHNWRQAQLLHIWSGGSVCYLKEILPV